LPADDFKALLAQGLEGLATGCVAGLLKDGGEKVVWTETRKRKVAVTVTAAFLSFKTLGLELLRGTTCYYTADGALRKLDGVVRDALGASGTAGSLWYLDIVRHRGQWRLNDKAVKCDGRAAEMRKRGALLAACHAHIRGFCCVHVLFKECRVQFLAGKGQAPGGRAFNFSIAPAAA
jgi:hypothetical protein